jgi:calcineurin-like phosphoesterase
VTNFVPKILNSGLSIFKVQTFKLDVKKLFSIAFFLKKAIYNFFEELKKYLKENKMKNDFAKLE